MKPLYATLAAAVLIAFLVIISAYETLVQGASLKTQIAGDDDE